MPFGESRKPPRRARNIAKGITRPRFFPHRRGPADAQLKDLHDALGMPAPQHAAGDGEAGRKMRLGPQGRALADRLGKSRTLREAKAWARELAHEIARRARIQERRDRIKRRVRDRGRKMWDGTKRGTGRVRDRISDRFPPRPSRSAPPSRKRAPVTRSRMNSGRVPADPNGPVRTTTVGERAARSRTPRKRTSPAVRS